MMRAVTVPPSSWEQDDEPVVPLSHDSAGDTRVVGLRGLQYFLDVLVIVVVALVVAVAVTFGLHALLGYEHLVLQALVFLSVWFSLAMLGFLVFYVWWPYRHGGRTPAMGWLRLRLVTVAGDEPPLSAYVVRWLLMVVDGFVFGLVGLLVMANSTRQQRVGDMVAGTIVVREPKRS
jgi:uncharacterized RDD family membrane protein YckC